MTRPRRRSSAFRLGTRGPALRAWVPALLALALLLGVRPASADVEIAPSTEGHLGAWLAVGPLRSSLFRSSELAAAEPRLGQAPLGGQSPPWRLLSHASGPLTLRSVLGGGADSPRVAVLGAILMVERGFDGWLLLAADGVARVLLDGVDLPVADQLRRSSAWEVLPLRAEAGEHRLLIALQASSPTAGIMVRLLQRADLRAPTRSWLRLPGVPESAATSLAGAMASIALAAPIVGDGYAPRASLAFQRGAPRNLPLLNAVRLDFGAREPWLESSLGSLVVPAEGAPPVELALPPLSAAELEKLGRGQRARLRWAVAGTTLERSLELSPEPLRLARAARELEQEVPLGSKPWLDRSVVVSSLRWGAAKLSELAGQQGIAAIQSREVQRSLDRLITPLRKGEDPLRAAGVVTLAHPASSDGSLQSFAVHIPSSYAHASERRYPLVVLLHGYNGSPTSVMQAFLDQTSQAAVPGVEGFVVAPEAHGNSFYRGAGEREVLDVLDWMLATYPIDPDRVSITGVSMGGTGAGHLAFRYADRFASAAPLCGYHSYFVRRDTSNRPLRDWEGLLMHGLSPASFAENGRHVPLYVAHGTRDFPLENSRVLVRRYQQLGYSVTDDWPALGHNVWQKTYARAGLWPWLTRARRPSAPLELVLKTDALRYGRRAWLNVLGFTTRREAAHVDATFTPPGRLRLRTQRVSSLHVDRTPPIPTAAPLTLEVDGETLEFGPMEEITLRRAQRWEKGASWNAKRAGLEGPLHDVFMGPVTFVYGSLDPRTARANREVAEAFARERDTSNVRYPVLSDRELLAASPDSTSNLFLVGTPDDHLQLGVRAAQLPIRVAGDSLVVGSERLTAPGIGALFIYPDPLQPTRYVVVLTAPDVPGLMRATALPKLLPDFIVYDERIAAAAGQKVLGHAQVVTAGFFDEGWQLP